MKKTIRLMMLSLLGLAGTAAAQNTAAPQVISGEAKLKADARADADEAKTRAQLDEARKRLDDAAREVAELSNKLALNEGNAMFIGGPPRAVLGVQIDVASDKRGARV